PPGSHSSGIPLELQSLPGASQMSGMLSVLQSVAPLATSVESATPFVLQSGVPVGTDTATLTLVGEPGLNSPSVAVPAPGAPLLSKRNVYIVPQRSALAFTFWAKVCVAQLRVPEASVGVQSVKEYGSPLW